MYISDSGQSTKIAVFYHLYQHDGWNDMFFEQSKLLVDCGLVETAEFVHIGINGLSVVETPTHKFKTIFNPKPWTEETSTLIDLKKFCAQNPDWRVLYMHTKGITQPMQSTKDWRKIMEYFCIERWGNCLEKLQTNDAAGCLYMDECYYGFYPHFSGNFWWANASYINRLDESYLVGGLRQNREFWIGSGNGSLFSFHTTGLNHYAHEYPRQLYAN